MITNKAALKAKLAELVATGNYLDGVVIHLSTDAVAFDVDITLADITHPTFTGYAVSSAVVWGTPCNSDDGAHVYGDLKQFIATADPVTPQTIYGYTVELPGTPNVLRYYESLASPVVIAKAGDSVPVLPRYEELNPPVTSA